MFARRKVSDIKSLNSEKTNPESNVDEVLINDDNMRGPHKVIFRGPKDSPYETGKFSLNVILPVEYPMVAPTITFETPIFHPNIDTKGNICLDLLKNQWASTCNLIFAIENIVSLLATPNPSDPLNPQASDLYKENKELFEKRVRDDIKKYAT